MPEFLIRPQEQQEGLRVKIRAIKAKVRAVRASQATLARILLTIKLRRALFVWFVVILLSTLLD
jgi:hypothetical protein